MISHIATAAVYVADQGAALAFWTEQVGFQVRARIPMGPQAEWLELSPTGAQSCLVIYPKSMMQDWAERKPSLVFTCADLSATHAAMAARGVNFSQPPQQMPWGLFAIFTDPEGHWYGLREGSPQAP